jgi:L-serine dehydratase
MIGPSSSHTAGAVRLGALARAIFGSQPTHAQIALHGSFATTGIGHGTDVALVAGLLNMAPDDERIPRAFTLGEKAGLDVVFSTTDLGEAHPNTAELTLSDSGGITMVIRGSSVGGGEVVITAIDNFEVIANGELPMLIVEHTDRPGVIAGVTGVLAEGNTNIAEMRVARERRGARALMLIETDLEIDDRCARRIAEQPGVTSVRRVPAI